MDLSDILSVCIRDVVKEEMPDIINQALKGFFDSHKDRQDNSKSNDHIDLNRVKDLTGYADTTIYSKVSKGEIPVLSRGRPLLFSKSDIELWIRADRPKTNNLEDIRSMPSLKKQ